MPTKAMKSGLTLAVTVTFAVLAGCNNKPKSEPQTPPPPPLIKEQKQVLDSAKGIDDTLGKQAEDQRKQIEEATK